MKKPKYIGRNKDEITYLVNARQKTYIHSTEIYIPNNPYEKIEEGYEPRKRPAGNGPTIPTPEEDKKDRSIRRTRTAVKDIALSNDFDLFVTFTFGNGRDDPDLCKKKLNGWLKRQRRVDKSFQYLVVPEFHSDDVSLHFHALINGYRGKLVRAINPNTNRPLVKNRRKVYDFPSYTLGHSEVYKIGIYEEDHIRTSFYLLKYIRKDMPNFKNKKKYWCSRGLNRPTITENPEEWYFALQPDHVITVPYGQYYFFHNKRIEIFLP